MTKVRFKYEKPVLVDLSCESVVGATCNPNGYATTDWCNDGSCASYVLCNAGSYTQACLNGTNACDSSSNCYAVCTTGSPVSDPQTAAYYCDNSGLSAAQYCYNGTRASNDCAATGGIYYSCA